jgi:hypothetical protein
MKIYTGQRLKGGDVHVTVSDAKGVRRLNPRLDLVNHSPNGFEWGYLGSGPAQLALAILADVLGDDTRADRLHQWVKERLIAPIDADHWKIIEQQVRDAVTDIEHELAHADDHRQ